MKGLVPLLGRGRGTVMREGGSLPGLGGGLQQNWCITRARGSSTLPLIASY